MSSLFNIFSTVINFFNEYSEKLYGKVFGVGGGIVFIILLLNFGSHWLFNIFGSASGLSFQKKSINEKLSKRGEKE